jgi:hypothetical protein
MEAAGVAQAVTERIHPVQWLVVRGISDHANEGKKALDDQKQTWRRYSVRNAAGLLRALLVWDGFRLAAGLRAPSTNGSESLARELARRLQVCTGGSWLAGIAFGVYTHAPRSGSGEAVDVAQLRVTDPEINTLVESAEKEKDRLLIHRDTQRTADAMTILLQKYNATLRAQDIALLRDFDNVVLTILCPDEDDGGVETLLLEADRLEEEVGIEAVIELLSEPGSPHPRLRERYLDALATAQRWPVIMGAISSTDVATFSRRELEHAIFACVKMNHPERARELLHQHEQQYTDNAAKIFRREAIVKT